MDRHPHDRVIDLVSRRVRREYPKMSPEERLCRWHKRIMKTSHRPLRCELRARIAADLKLDDPWVILNLDGTLVHVTSGTIIIS